MSAKPQPDPGQDWFEVGSYTQGYRDGYGQGEADVLHWLDLHGQAGLSIKYREERDGRVHDSPTDPQAPSED